MLTLTTKVVKVPVRILEEAEDLRLLKYKALDAMMSEARYLGNMAIRYAIAFKLDGIPKEISQVSGKQVVLDTRIYRILAQKRKYLDASTVATLSRNYALKLLKKSDKDAWEGRKSLPTFRSLFVPFRHQGTKMTVIEENGHSQFIIEPPFGKKWLPEDFVNIQNSSSIRDHDKQSKLTLVSIFSWKDKDAREIVGRIVSGEYLMCDSQIKKSGKNLIVYLTYKFKNLQPKPDTEKVCGVYLGAMIPVVCAVNFGAQRMNIGSEADIWAARSKFRAERRRKQRRLGTDTVPRRWQRSEKEERWMHTYYHALTRQVIRFCLQHGCGKIHLAVLDKSRRSEQRNSGKQLVSASSTFYTMLDYKAKELGIRTVKIHTGNGDYRCSECGHFPSASAEVESLFTCVQCGCRTNADYNAARNVCLVSVDGVEPMRGEHNSNEVVLLGGIMPQGMVLRPVLRPRAVHGAVSTAYE
jgi:transposase